jgi:hypothetical protein
MTAKQTIASWGDLKEYLSHVLNVPQAALHVAVGLLLYPLFARCMGVGLGSWRPLWPILALEIANEAIDVARYAVSRWPWTPAGTIYDLLMTMAPVALLVLVCRRVRGAPGQIPQ